MPPIKASYNESLWLDQAGGCQGTVQMWTNLGRKGLSRGGSGLLTRSLMVSRFQREIPKSHKVAHCLEQNLMHSHPSFPK